MRPDSKTTLLGLALLLGACAPDFNAVLHVTIDGPALEPGGGYWIVDENGIIIDFTYEGYCRPI